MASFSRGLLLPGLRRPTFAFRSSTIASEPTILRIRSLTTSSISLRAAQATQRASRASQQQAAKNVSSPAAASTKYAFVKSLAMKATPTILYEAPSHFWFYFGCWSSALFIFGWTLATSQPLINPPEGVPAWTGYVFIAVYAIFIAIGMYLVSKTPNIVSSIRLLPRHARTPVPAGTIQAPAPQIEFTVRRMVPFMSPKVITTDLDKARMESRFALPEEYVPGLLRREEERERGEARKRKELRRFDLDHSMTMPIRHTGRALMKPFRAAFEGIKSALTDQGFGVVEIDGKRYRVDVTGGFAHDGFRTMEKLLM